MTTLVLGSRNSHKLLEVSRVLEPLGYHLEALPDHCVEVVEDGKSFAANARKKAQGYSQQLGLPVLADDSGLCVDALEGAPGIHSARFSASGLDGDNNQLLLKRMHDVAQEERGAAYVCALCLIIPGGDTVEVQAQCQGHIAYACEGEGGFGYDSLFIYSGDSDTPNERGSNFAQVAPGIKDALSHRSKALKLLVEAL